MNFCIQLEKTFLITENKAHNHKNCYKYILTVSKLYVMSRQFIDKGKQT